MPKMDYRSMSIEELEIRYNELKTQIKDLELSIKKVESEIEPLKDRLKDLNEKLAPVIEWYKTTAEAEIEKAKDLVSYYKNKVWCENDELEQFDIKRTTQPDTWRTSIVNRLHKSEADLKEAEDRLETRTKEIEEEYSEKTSELRKIEKQYNKLSNQKYNINKKLAFLNYQSSEVFWELDRQKRNLEYAKKLEKEKQDSE